MNSQATDAEVAALVTKVILGGSSPGEPFSSWLVKLMMAGSAQPGFVSAEILPPDGKEPQAWTLVQRYRTSQNIVNWKASNIQVNLLAELKSVLPAGDFELTQDEHEHYGTRGNVTTAIVTQVNPGKEGEYRDWEARVQTAQAIFPGYQGSYLQPPTGGASGMWVTLLRFDKPESLENWFTSPQRQELVKESTALVKSLDVKRIGNSFPGWVPVDASGQGPPNWKTFLLVLLGLYPIVTFEIRFLMPQLGFLPHAIANLIGNAISVALTTWLTMPLFIKWFGPWLFPPANQSSGDRTKWIVLMIACFTLVVALMWNVV